MDFITIDKNNIDKEHICCSISDKKGENCVGSKKAWMKERFVDGLVFFKADVRGKVFIEYIPAEKAWCPIEAPDYMFINCFWVSGQFKGKGLSNNLLEHCIEDSTLKGKQGLCILSGIKKLPFLSDPKYMKYKGFKTSDTASPYYELLYLPFSSQSPVPKFKACVKNTGISETGMVLYYTNQCPHTEKYSVIISDIAKSRGESVKLIKFTSAEEAMNAPAPFTAYSFFDNGKFVTNEIFSETKFTKYLDKRQGI